MPDNYHKNRWTERTSLFEGHPGVVGIKRRKPSKSFEILSTDSPRASMKFETDLGWQPGGGPKWTRRACTSSASPMVTS